MYFVVYATSFLDITTAEWALIVTFEYLTIAVPAIIAGLSMDKKGRKSLILGYLLYVPGMLLFIYGSFHMLLLAFFFFGLATCCNLTVTRSQPLKKFRNPKPI